MPAEGQCLVLQTMAPPAAAASWTGKNGDTCNQTCRLLLFKAAFQAGNCRAASEFPTLAALPTSLPSAAGLRGTRSLVWELGEFTQQRLERGRRLLAESEEHRDSPDLKVGWRAPAVAAVAATAAGQRQRYGRQ